VIVADECRGTGLSGALVRYALSVVSRLGIDRVFLECIPGHRSLYEKHGFRLLEIKRKRVVDVNKSMIAMELVRDSVAPMPSLSPAEDWIGPEELRELSYLCACAQRDCFEGMYAYYATARCPLVGNRYYHANLCRTINLGRLQS
jgi:hypothetical protein